MAWARATASSIASFVPDPIVKCAVWAASPMSTMRSRCHDSQRTVTKLVHTERFDDDWTGGETVVTTTLDEDRGRTTLTSTILFASKAARDGARETGFDAGMEQAYDTLAGLLAEEAR